MAIRPVSPYKSRDEAAANGHARYFPGDECKHGHRAERFTANGGCVMCVNRSRSPITGRNVRGLPKPLVFPAGGADPTPELMEYIYERVQASIPQLVADFHAARPELAPADPFEGLQLTAKAGNATLADFTKLGWTRDTLLQNGYLEPVSQPTE